MSDPAGPPAVPAAHSAGAMLRSARKAQGMHLAALAAAIKVTPRKLELLENDRYDELPDATFARALAKSVCHVLKIDAGPVLAMLPKATSQGFERLGGGLNEPYRERSSRPSETDAQRLRRPALLGALLLLVAAAVVLLVPMDVLTRWRRGDAPAEVASAPPLASDAAVFASSPLVPMPAASAPLAESAAAASAVPAAPSASSPGGDQAPVGLVVLHTANDSPVEVLDGQGHTLLSRTMQAGELVALDGTPPLRLRIGNARGTEVLFRGRPVDIGPLTRDNVARFELK